MKEKIIPAKIVIKNVYGVEIFVDGELLQNDEIREVKQITQELENLIKGKYIEVVK